MKLLGGNGRAFLNGKYGRIVGEKITRTVEKATEENLPLVIVACSGGARMQEGIIPLCKWQNIGSLKRHSESGNLYISVLPIQQQVELLQVLQCWGYYYNRWSYCKFCNAGDIIMAEPDALIGFAGPRVIEQTIGQKLPKGFQKSE
ncbi:hypothetical protein DXA21_20670 [Parabacteroides distasonis]|nr:hypothetical protein DXA21_20670 [Parabacteroides distasonis]